MNNAPASSIFPNSMPTSIAIRNNSNSILFPSTAEGVYFGQLRNSSSRSEPGKHTQKDAKTPPIRNEPPIPMDEELNVPTQVWSKDHERVFEESFFLDTAETDISKVAKKDPLSDIPKGPEIGRDDVPQSGAPFGIGAKVDKHTGKIKTSQAAQQDQSHHDLHVTAESKKNEHIVHRQIYPEEKKPHSPTYKAPNEHLSEKKQVGYYENETVSSPPLSATEDLLDSMYKAHKSTATHKIQRGVGKEVETGKEKTANVASKAGTNSK